MGVALTVKPLVETGVVLALTMPLTAQPVLLVGLVQGEVRVSFSRWTPCLFSSAAAQSVSVLRAVPHPSPGAV